MKSAFVFVLLVGVAVAQQFGSGSPIMGALGGGAGGSAIGGPGGVGPAGPAMGNTGNPWGARAYGMGLNNPWAMPVNPFMMRRALALIQNIPNALVRVDVDGEVQITNQFGQEVDIHDGFGNELTDMF